MKDRICVSEEDKWLKKVQNKLKKYILSPIWDAIELSDTNYAILERIMNAEKANDLPYSINERVVDYLIEDIDKKYKQMKKHIVKHKEYEM